MLPAIYNPPGFAQESAPPAAGDIAKQLANPIASLISVPLQFNWDDNFWLSDHDSAPQFVRYSVPPL